jgi:serine/threonine-protein kinase RsbW
MRNEVVIPSKGDAARLLCREIVHQLSSNFGSGERFEIQLAIEEAMINAVEHGNKGDASKRVFVQYGIEDGNFEITITDEGDGFKPEAVPDPLADENLNKASGRGLALMRVYMDAVEYSAKGNSVHMAKKSKSGNVSP